jgi:hypothetical protein
MKRHILAGGGWIFGRGLAVGVVGREPLCVLESSFIRPSDTIGFYTAESVQNILLLAHVLICMPLRWLRTVKGFVGGTVGFMNG